ncbi:MAG: hypothetical protein ACO20H_13255 [Bacteriovoracaceae bacterium]
MKLIIMLILPLSLFAAESPQTWLCTHKHNKFVRKVELIEHEDNSCEVIYSKPYENEEPKIIFYAKNTPHFCKEKNTDFLERRMQEELGWRCDVMKDKLIYGQ